MHMLQLFVQCDANVIKPVGLLRRGRLDVYVMTLILDQVTAFVICITKAVTRFSKVDQ